MQMPNNPLHLENTSPTSSVGACGTVSLRIRYAAQEVRQWGREEVSLHVDYPCESAQAAETQQHRLGSFNNRGLSARRCGGCESEVWGPARWGSSEGSLPFPLCARVNLSFVL